jgi:histidine triad (HIT) family protein
MEDCVFCKIIRNEIPSTKIWENDDFIAFMNIEPWQEGHILLIPKEHIDYLFDIPEPEYGYMFTIAKELAKKIKKALNCEKVGIAVEGIAVRHAHLHMIPINKINDIDPCNATKPSREQLEEVAKKIINEIR